MQHDDPDGLLLGHKFNQALMEALGYGHLEHVIELSMSCRGDELPSIEISMAPTNGQTQALADLLGRTRFKLVLAGPADVSAADGSEDRSAAAESRPSGA